MLATFALSHVLWLISAIILEILANICLKLSNGFQKKLLGGTAIACVLASFTALSFAINGISLSIAYILCGVFGILATTIAGMILFKQKLNYKGWTGIGLLAIGMVLIKLA